MRCRGPAWPTSANSPIAPASWSAGAIGDPHALVVLPPVQDTRRSSGCPVLSRSLSCLWVVPVFAGREVLRLNSVAHKPLRGLISRFFCYPPGYPPNELTSPQILKLSTTPSTAMERLGWVRTPSMRRGHGGSAAQGAARTRQDPRPSSGRTTPSPRTGPASAPTTAEPCDLEDGDDVLWADVG